MSEITRVALDAMGGDNAPQAMVQGAVDVARKRKDIQIFLVGQEEVVNAELKKYDYPKERIEVVHASEVIETAEPPVMAIRKKKDSSIVVALNMVNRSWYEDGEERRGRCFCFSRKLRSSIGWRTVDRRKDQRGGTSAFGTAYADREGSFSID